MRNNVDPGVAFIATILATILATTPLVASAHDHAFSFGHPGKPDQVTREVRVAALDIKFEPAAIEAKAGETIRFIVTNSGKLPHEFVLGDAALQAQHEREMQVMATMTAHDHPNGISLASGQTKELIWTFTKTGRIEYGCHVAGHFAAGMVGTVAVAAESPAVPAAPAAVVDAFSKAIKVGDLAAATALLDPDLQVFESGYIERSAKEYAGNHMKEDAEFLKAATVTQLSRTGSVTGDLAWVGTEQRIQAVARGKPVDVVGTETMVLRKTAAGWRITHIHWSSHPYKKG